MNSETNLIQQAEFNPKIKTYILLIGAFFLIVTLFGIPLLILWFLGVGQKLSARYYENLRCRLTTKHLEFKKGLFFKVEKTIPLENIQDLTFIENPILKYLDLRILKIETAGSSNQNGSDMKLVGIIDSSEFKKKVLQQREALNNKNQLRTSTSSDIGTDNEVLIEIRDLLKEIKDTL